MIRQLAPILILSLLFSCAGNKLPGLYGNCPKHYYACSQYLFKENEFEYFNFIDVGGATVVKGHWISYHDTIVLNSYVQPGDRIVGVIESKIDSSSNLSFEFYNESIKGNDGAFVRLNSDSSKPYLLTTGDSMSSPQGKLTKLFISPFFDSQAFPILYKVKNSNSNHFFVRIKNIDQSIFITNERFLKIRRTLYRLDSNGKLIKNNFYRKVKLSKKEF